ncbi:DUF2507 domain-containing protein [Alkalibacterium sp. f15]|uniref:DUF2507 domain-containing protein n=1 Tax=Alkalibacterium sp. f15 TaxID=3414029 RepID=UPI003BF78069
MQSENQATDPLKSISLLRDYLLPNLLKEDEKDILYWAGKELARSNTFDSLEELTEQMTTIFLGELIQTKSTKNTNLYDWSGPLVSHRLTTQTAPNFSLEAGFLAEGYQQIAGTYTEATYELDFKKNRVTILLQSDHHVSLNEN